MLEKIFGFCLILSILFVVTGCNENSKVNSPTVVPTSTPTNLPTTEPTTEDIQGTGMNLTQIQAGDYSSLLGTWIEVAYSDNKFDGSGQQWHAGTSAKPRTLSVSTDKIVFNHTAMVMQGNTITDAAGSHLLSFANIKGFLYAELADAKTVTINWTVTFYPKGIANDIKPNNGVKIDNTKDLIDIWYSGMRNEIIFAKTK